MRRAPHCCFWSGLGFVLTLSVLNLAGAPANPLHAETTFYFDRQAKIPLEAADFVAIRWRSGESQAVLSDFPQVRALDRRELPREQLIFYPVSLSPETANRKSLMEDLRRRVEIQQVMPVYRAPEALMIPGDQMLARFTPSSDEEAITDLGTALGFEIRERIAWAPSTYLLEATSGNALDAANRLHERMEVIWAHPDFLRIVERPHLSGKPLPDATFQSKASESEIAAQAAKGTSWPRFSELTTFRSPTGLALPGASAGVAAVERLSLVQEDFEGVFPGNWQLHGEPTWSGATLRPYSGSWSGYAVGSDIAPPGPYPNHVDAWMIYGPFSLVGAVAARVDLQAWIQTESYYDYFKAAVSIDGGQWYGLRFSGDWGGWRNIALDLAEVPTLGNLLGQPQVWLALVFQSDVSIAYEGVYVDDIVIETITGGYQDLTSDQFDHLQWSLNNVEQRWGVEGADIAAVEAWSISRGSNGVTIAIIDEGIDLAHPDLAGKLVPGYDATGGDSAGGATGDEAHGTACAAVAAAMTDNDRGVAGVTHGARLMPIRIFVNGYTRDSWAADGIYWAVAHGADILSNSWGGGLPSAAITDAIEFAAAQGRDGLGSVVVSAAGNANQESISYPASLSSTLAVGALSPCDQRKSYTSCDGEFWWGSNYGSGLGVTAPGVLIYSADISGTAGYVTGDYVPDFNGTSSATPLVAGVAALLLGIDPNLPASSVETLIFGSANDLPPIGWDPETGHGRLNASQALLDLLTLTTDLEAAEVFFRDLPNGEGNLIDTPHVDQEVYPHLRLVASSLTSVTGTLATLSIDSSLLCEIVDSVDSGEHIVSCLAPWKATAGSHEMLALLDPEDSIAEFDETNNSAAISFEVPQLQATIFEDTFESGDTTAWSRWQP